jgi:hypothetical protein
MTELSVFFNCGKRGLVECFYLDFLYKFKFSITAELQIQLSGDNLLNYYQNPNLDLLRLLKDLQHYLEAFAFILSNMGLIER